MIITNSLNQEALENNPVWVVRLSNGETAYKDDCLYEGKLPSSWLRLKEYCEVNELKIVDMKVKFRSNELSLPDNKDGYYFKHCVRGYFHSERSYYYFIVGYLEDNKIKTKKILVPELNVQEEEDRDIEENKESLIS